MTNKAFEHLVEHIGNSSSPDDGIQAFATGVKGIIDAALLDTKDNGRGVIVMDRAALQSLVTLSEDLDGCVKAVVAAIANKPDLTKVNK